MTTPAYRLCRKPGCGFSIENGKKRCLRCGTPVQEREFNTTAPAPRRVDNSKVKLCRGWR